jgi:DNA-binding response OmpR family regulator
MSEMSKRRMPAAARILIVEDNQLVRRMLSRRLAASGFGVSSVESSTEAMEQLSGEPVDLVLSDVNLPGGDGFSLIERMRARDLPTPVILISGASGDDRTAMARGAAGYFEKPFDFEELVGAITLALAG